MNAAAIGCARALAAALLLAPCCAELAPVIHWLRYIFRSARIQSPLKAQDWILVTKHFQIIKALHQ